MDAAQANAPRLDPTSTRGHYESWFLRANHPSRPLALWVRYTLFVPAGLRAGLGADHAEARTLPVGTHPGLSGHAHAELFAIWFDGVGHHHVAVREVIDLRDCAAAPEGLHLRLGGSTLDAESAIGSARSGEHAIGWDLELSGGGEPLLLMPRDRYEARIPKAKALVPLPLVRMTGTIDVDGEPHRIDGWIGSQNHNWGERHTDLYAWGQVAGFDDEPDAFLECGTGRLKIGPIWSPPITLMVARVRGVEYALNSLGGGLRARAQYEPGYLALSGGAGDMTMSATFEAPLADCVGIAYDNPPGGVKTCLNTKLATATLTIARRDAPEVALRATRRGALELLTDDVLDDVPILR